MITSAAWASGDAGQGVTAWPYTYFWTRSGGSVLKARGIAGAVMAMAAALALAGCGGDDGRPSGTSTKAASPTVQGDPYREAPWRLQVVNLLDALRTPEDGKYRNWMMDDTELWTMEFIYTPRRASDPEWDRRSNDGSAVAYPGKMTASEKKAFFAAITRDNTVISSSLTVVDAGDETVAGDNSYKFTFKVRTSDGQWLTGMAIGSPGTDPAKGRITRLTYDVTKS